jgi:ERCC4 domain/Lsr2
VLDDLLVARNPDASSSLPYLIRVPLGPGGIVVKARETWSRTSKVYCHRAEGWPADAEIVERHAVRSCVRRGPAIDLVLDRARENRSQLVLTRARGREVIFWQSPRTARQARPAVTLPTARAHGRVLDIVVDSGEKYPYTFRRQQATTSRRRLPAGDYAVEAAGRVVAAVERKTLEDLAGSLLSGRLTYALAELTALPRAAVVVEDRYGRLFKLAHVSGTAVAEALAEAQARFPSVPVTFCKTRALVEEGTYRWLGACLAEIGDAEATAGLEQTFAPGRPVPAPEPSARTVRSWARSQGIEISDRGRVPADLLRAYAEAQEATP